MYKYWGFGLKISSEIEFPELLPLDFPITDTDLIINIGSVPSSVEGKSPIRKTFSIFTTDEYLLNVKNICKYYSCYGKKIIVEPVAGADVFDVRLFLLETVMASIFYQRLLIPLSASAIVKNSSVVLFVGNSNSGKSTLLAYLLSRGFEFFTDDICVLRYNKERTEVLCASSYPMMKLWGNTISNLKYDKFNNNFRIRKNIPKYGQFFHDSFNTNLLPIKKIFILDQSSFEGEIVAQKISHIDAFKKLENCTYQNQLIKSSILRVTHFSLISYLSSQIPIIEVICPKQNGKIDLIFDVIKNELDVS